MPQLRKKCSEIAILIIVSVASLTLCGEPLLAQTNSGEEPLSTKDWIDFVFRLSSTSFALFTLWKGLERYKIDQAWKRAEFVVEQIQNFESDPENKNVLLMLDWKDREFEIDGNLKVKVTDELLIRALREVDLHAVGSRVYFLPEENWIRYNFNNFLDALENFSYYIEAGLVTKKDLEPYLNYWLNLLANPNNQMHRPIEFYQNLWKFIYHYNYLSIQKLCECFDYKISDIFELSDREELQRYYSMENYSIGRYSSPTISTSLYF